MALPFKPSDRDTVVPYLVVGDPQAVIDFLQSAFSAELIEKIEHEDGINHAEVRIGTSTIMMGKAQSEWPAMTSMNYVYVEDTDRCYERALAAGAESIMAPDDQFYGHRNAGVRGPQGNSWWIATLIEEVAPDELKRRAEAAREK